MNSVSSFTALRTAAVRLSAVKTAPIKRFASDAIPNSAKVVRFSANGAPSNVLRVEEEALPRQLGSGQVLVEMLAAPIHPSDLNLVEGIYGTRATLPAVGGTEGVANVVAVGTGVTGLAVGDRVVPARAGLGTWRTHGVFESAQWERVSKALPVHFAATLTINPMTALRLLDDFVPLKAGDVVVQNAANSAVGKAVVQLCKARGVRTVNVVRERAEFEDCVELLKILGGDIVVSERYARTPPFRRMLADMEPARLALNAVGGSSATELVRCLGEGGTMVTYGGMSRQPVTVPTSQLIFKDVRVRGFWLSRWLETADEQSKAAARLQLVEQLGSGQLRNFTELHPFAEFEQALARAQQPYRQHKVLLQFKPF